MKYGITKEFEEMSSIVHFEIPADDLQRARSFYTNLFGWKFEGVQSMDYMLVDTYGLGGGLVKRMQPNQQIFVQIGVPSVDEYTAKVEKLGGKIIAPKTAIPGMGYFAICTDTENNVFGIVETDHTVPGRLLVSGAK